MTKLQLGIGSALAVAGATGFALQARTNAKLSDEVAALRQQNAALAAVRAENTALARTAAEMAEMKGDDAALARLNDEATALKVRAQQLARAERAASREPMLEPSQLDRQPRPRSQARPKYPVMLREAGVVGDVVVDFVVDQNGNVQNAHRLKATVTGQKTDEDKAAGVVKLAPFTVMGDATANSDGRPDGTNVLINGVTAAQSAQLLGDAAVEAVSQWKFEAGAKGGRAVNTHLQVPIIFTLGDDEAATPVKPKAGP